MAFTAHRTRKLYPAGLYDGPLHGADACEYGPHDDQCPDDHWTSGPHHVHVANGCTDHQVENCPDDHWIGGRPEQHPHHVEYDGSTGRWGYTRLSEKEIADLKLLWEYEQELRDQVEKKAATAQAADRELIEKEAKRSPAFAALARRAGLIE